jgi:hypothetical protein
MGKLVAAGGVMIDEASLRPLANAIDEICRARGVPPETELKWSPPRGNWLREHLHGDDRAGLFVACLEALRQHGGRAGAVVWDTGRTTLKGQGAFEKAVEWALERFVMQLSGAELGAVIVDRAGGNTRSEDRMLAAAVKRIEQGTPYVGLSEHIALNLLTTPSHLSRHVQLADLVAGSSPHVSLRDPFFDAGRPAGHVIQEQHTWVVVDDVLIDITASQFNDHCTHAGFPVRAHCRDDGAATDKGT